MRVGGNLMAPVGFGKSGELRVSGRPWPSGWPPPPVARITDIARMVNAVADQPVTERTVRTWLYESQPQSDTKRPRRYSNTPIPAPDRYVGTVPEWIVRPGLDEEMQQWYLRARPGRGSGGGRPRRGTEEQPVPEPAPRQPRQSTTTPEEGTP
jgi:hypothetical protein